MSLLEGIKTPSDLKKLSVESLCGVAEELRERIIGVVDKNGGHLSSNLGAVDVILALYYVFDFPKDKLIFDVGHQAYAHKILGGRNDVFDTIRKSGGLSGFPNIFESEYDSFCVGHAGNSISAGLGYCNARDTLMQDYYVIDFVGDASLFNGENLEAITSNDKKPNKFIIILNDNGMSISKNNNGMYKFVSKMTTRKSYGAFMRFASVTLGRLFIGRALKKFKNFIKFNMNRTTVIEAVGLKYLGIFDGHNIKELVRIFNDVKNADEAVLLHLKTIKGKGMHEAENKSDYYHGVGRNLLQGGNTFSQAVGEKLCEVAASDERIVALCAAMKDGTGLNKFSELFPNRFYDVGIAEEHAVTLAAGMALGGLRPFVCIYSTFLQRAYDQIMQDVCMQKLPVIFMVDRAGAVGSDGATHQGLFDITYLRSIPNLNVFAPKDAEELKITIDHCLSLSLPCAIRYPNGHYENAAVHTPFSASLWEGETNSDNVILAVGPRMNELAWKVSEKCVGKVCVVNARSIKPLDEKLLEKIANKNIITLEENVRSGGFGSAVMEYYALHGLSPRIKAFAYPDEFIPPGTQSEQMGLAGITTDKIIDALI